VEELLANPLQAAGALGHPKVPEGPSVLLTDRSADHLQEVATFLVQTVMVEAVHSDAVEVEVARGASPVVVSPVAVPLEVSLVGVEASLVAVVVGVAEVANKSMPSFMTENAPSVWITVTKPVSVK
jgi:hypothetical protein